MGIEKIKLRRPETHQKGWGRELWLANGEKYCGKLLEFNEGSKFSMHYHMVKEETFYVLKGKLTLIMFDLATAEEERRELAVGDVVDIPAGNPHQIVAKEHSIIIEISTEHFEDDSYRVRKGDSQKNGKADTDN